MAMANDCLLKWLSTICHWKYQGHRYHPSFLKEYVFKKLKLKLRVKIQNGKKNLASLTFNYSSGHLAQWIYIFGFFVVKLTTLTNVKLWMITSANNLTSSFWVIILIFFPTRLNFPTSFYPSAEYFYEFMPKFIPLYVE